MTSLDEPASAVGPATASFVLNGTPVSVHRRHPHLLAALREELDVTSPKDGCSPSGQCGCCTVLIDGKAIVSCQQPLDKIEGTSVVTLEGVDRAGDLVARGGGRVALLAAQHQARVVAAGRSSPSSSLQLCNTKPSRSVPPHR